MRTRLATFILLSALLVVSACSTNSSGYFRHFDNSPVRYEIVADEHAQVYRAAYEICRWQHRAGYITLKQPLPHDGWDFMGRFQCSGEFDPTLAIRYEYLDTAFKYGNQPFSDKYYFRFPGRSSSRNRDRLIRTNTLTEEPASQFMRDY